MQTALRSCPCTCAVAHPWAVACCTPDRRPDSFTCACTGSCACTCPEARFWVASCVSARPDPDYSCVAYGAERTGIRVGKWIVIIETVIASHNVGKAT